MARIDLIPKSFTFAGLALLAAFSAFAAAPAAPATQPKPVQAAEAPPTFMVDKAGKREHIDFGLTPLSISAPGMRFSGFANRKLVIFYFSAKCPHCQHAIPHVQKLTDELAAKGYAAVAIAVKFNSEDEIRGFIRDYKVHIPVFQDVDRTFGDKYGTGSIPLLYVVNEKGEFIRYEKFEAEKTPELIKAETAKLDPKPKTKSDSAHKPKPDSQPKP